jgi:hypothetical protein
VAQKWLGSAQYLFIPLIVQNASGYLSPPANFQDFVARRVHYDPDPVTFLDRSLASYIADISYGRASLNARVSQPVVINGLPEDDSMTLAAIQAEPNSHLYEYLAVVYPPNQRGSGSGMSQVGQIQFNPPRQPNFTKARSRFLFDAPVGVWAMELLHNVTLIGDYYNGVQHPGRYDEMADSAATHPCAYTKLEAGWLDPGTVPGHRGPARTYTLHAIALPHPPSDGRVAAVKIQAPGSNRYLIVEARLRSDRWDRGFTAADFPGTGQHWNYLGIGAENSRYGEGVIIYEYSPPEESWPRLDPNGPWPPLELRGVFTAGETFTHFDASTTTPGVVDHRTGIGRNRVISVQSQIAGGYVVQISTDERL